MVNDKNNTLQYYSRFTNSSLARIYDVISLNTKRGFLKPG